MNIVKKSLLIIFIVISLGFLPITYHRVYALESVTPYGSNSGGSPSASGYFNTRLSPTGNIVVGQLNTLYSDRSYLFSAFINKSVVVNKTYKIRLNYNDYDFNKNNNSTYVKIQPYNSDEPGSYCTIVSFTLLNQGGVNNQAKGVDIEFLCSESGNYFFISIAKYDDVNDVWKNITTIDWRLNSIQWEQVQTDGTQDIINNQTNNTQNIINNDNNNTQSIIDNQNQNTQDIIDAQKVCKDGLAYKGYLNNTSIFANNNLVYFERNTGLKTFIYESSEDKTYSFKFKNYNRLRVYESNTLYSESEVPFNITGSLLIDTSSPIIDTTYQITTSKKYIYFMLSNTSSNTGEIEIEQECVNGNQAISDGLNDLDNSINNSDVDNSEYADFFSNFSTDTFGLTSIITAPLNLIQSLTSSSCTKLEIPLPYVNNKKIELPCMTPIYQSTFGSLFTMYQTITFGIIAYWVCVRIFNMVKDFKNPEHDEIEVVDL